MELIQRFWEFGPKARLSTTAIVIYLYLLKLASDNNGYNVVISDVMLSETLGLTRKTIKPAKEVLRNLGLIQYESRKGLSCSYRIVLDYPLQAPGQEKGQKIINNLQVQILKKSNNSPLVEPSGIPIPETTEQKESTFLYNNVPEPFKTTKGPSLEEFMAYAHTLDGYEGSMDLDIEEKYALWAGNGWRNNLGKPIANWKSSLKNILPYMKNKTDNGLFSVESIPNIKHPK
ncbi:helix-turn-helix domain-containing protein [Elizabethkingia anophelis]|uniref:helix-turn-helix domain-containing protein n=1 Tax=Elizabethkingia anophelis TaxID=1117645 RepID=UPI0015E5E64D|nr:helix-turn-helix domain-containing protein [Elizabethkingia anophelis]